MNAPYSALAAAKEKRVPVKRWAVNVCAMLLVIAALSGYFLFLHPAWNAMKQATLIAHIIGGLIFTGFFAYFTAYHLKSSIRKNRAGGAMLLFIALGVLFYLSFNNYVSWRFSKYGLVLVYFLLFTQRKAVFATLGALFVAYLAMNYPHPLDWLILDAPEAMDTMLFVLLWVAYFWRPAKNQDPIDGLQGKYLLGVLSQLALGFVIYSGLIEILGFAIYDGGVVVVQIHKIAGFIAAPLTLVHMYQFFAKRNPDLGKAIGENLKKWVGALAPTAAAFAVLALIASQLHEMPTALQVDPNYSQKYANKLFGPSEMKTSTNTFLNPDTIDNTMTCGNNVNCHATVIEQWQASTHSYSGRTAIFQALYGVIHDEQGAEAARFCAGCHIPADLAAGNINPDRDLKHKESGITCTACHLIKDVDALAGNGGYTLEVQPQYLIQYRDSFGVAKIEGESFGGGVKRHAARIGLSWLLKGDPRQHTQFFNKPVSLTSDVCAPCHLQYVHEEMNGFGTVNLQDQYKSWRESEYNIPDKLGKVTRCQDCHMPFLQGNSFQAPIRDHRFIAANLYLPTIFKNELQVELTEKFLKGETDEIGSYFPGQLWRTGYIQKTSYPSEKLWPRGPIISLDLIDAPEAVQAGETISFTARTTNTRVGHVFPTGPLDLLQIWLEVRLLDSKGNVVYAHGGLDDKLHLIPESIKLGGDEVDENDVPVPLHRVWLFRRVANKREIQPKKSLDDNIEIKIPADASGDLTLRLSWRYRNVSQAVLDFVNPIIDPAQVTPTSPAVELVATEKQIRVSGSL